MNSTCYVHEKAIYRVAFFSLGLSSHPAYLQEKEMILKHVFIC